MVYHAWWFAFRLQHKRLRREWFVTNKKTSKTLLVRCLKQASQTAPETNIVMNWHEALNSSCNTLYWKSTQHNSWTLHLEAVVMLIFWTSGSQKGASSWKSLTKCRDLWSMNCRSRKESWVGGSAPHLERVVDVRCVSSRVCWWNDLVT